MEAQDNDEIRPFFSFRYGEFLGLEPESTFRSVGLNQCGGVALGMHVEDWWGIEVPLDLAEFTLDSKRYGGLGEYAVYSCTPSFVLRRPLGKTRWVPYLQAGFGFAFGEFNDGKPSDEGGFSDLQGQIGFRLYLTRPHALRDTPADL